VHVGRHDQRHEISGDAELVDLFEQCEELFGVIGHVRGDLVLEVDRLTSRRSDDHRAFVLRGVHARVLRGQPSRQCQQLRRRRARIRSGVHERELSPDGRVVLVRAMRDTKRQAAQLDLDERLVSDCVRCVAHTSTSAVSSNHTAGEVDLVMTGARRAAR
jgi:hypothetical protein